VAVQQNREGSTASTYEYYISTFLGRAYFSPGILSVFGLPLFNDCLAPKCSLHGFAFLALEDQQADRGYMQNP